MAGPTILKVPIESFAHEILTDLPKLMQDYPAGVTIHNLHIEYGESPARILKAISILESKELVTVHKAANNSSYIRPVSDGMPVEFGDLTDLQRRTLLFIRKTCEDAKTTRVSTNYMQLMRIMKCSPTGLRTCIDRLVQLGYLVIDQPSRHGKQSDLIIALGKKIIRPSE